MKEVLRKNLGNDNLDINTFTKTVDYKKIKNRCLLIDYNIS